MTSLFRGAACRRVAALLRPLTAVPSAVASAAVRHTISSAGSRAFTTTLVRPSSSSSALSAPLARRLPVVSSTSPALAPVDVGAVLASVGLGSAVAVAPARAFHVKKKTNKNLGKYKLKTHRATAKRFHVTGGGKIMRWRANHRHLLRHKSQSQLQRLSKRVEIPRAYYKKYRRSMPYAI